MRFRSNYDWQLGTEMSPLELEYKKQYIKKNTAGLNVPHTFDEAMDVPKTIDAKERYLFLTDRLLEEKFFEATQDVGVYRHPRYLPAFWHSHSFLEIVCVIWGEAVNYIGDNVVHMKEGDVLILAPDTQHTLSVFDDESIIINLIIRTSSFEHAFFGVLTENDILSEFFRRMLYHTPNHPYLYFEAGKDYELFNYIGYAMEEFQGKREYRNRMINGIMTGFFITLLRKHGADVILPAVHTYGEDENVVFLLKYLQENYKTVTLCELASFFNYSERQIQRIIKDATGLSFRENILKMRMTTAARLLKSTQLSVAEISDRLNYESPANFRTAFNRYYGVSPTEYRKKQSDVV